MRHILFISYICFAAVGGLHATSSEVERLKGVIDAAIEALYGDCCADLPAEEKQQKVREAIESEYDLDVIIRRAIGRNWRSMNSEEQEEVLELVKQLLVKAYVDGLEGRDPPKVELGEVVSITDRRIEIPSRVTIDNQTVNVLYRLGKMSSGWQIYDIVAEDISVVANYRQQIDDHFRRGDGQGLIKKLKALLAQDEIDEEIQL